MKKIITLALTMFFVIALAGCKSKDPLKKFLDKMETEKNCEMEMVMQVPVLGKIKVISEVDGNKMHMSSFLDLGETYSEEVEGVTYQYSQALGGNWVKTVQEATAEDSEFDTVENLKFEDFTKGKDGKYTLKEDKTASYKVDSLVIELIKNGAIMTMEKAEQGMLMTIAITISKIGEVSVTLPTVSND